MTRRAVRRDRGLRSGAPHTAPHAGPGAAPLRSGAAPAGGARKRGRAVGVRGEGRGCAKWRRVSPAPVPSRPVPRGAAAGGCSSRARRARVSARPAGRCGGGRFPPRPAPPRRRGRRRRRRPPPRGPRGRPASPAPSRPAPLRSGRRRGCPRLRLPRAAGCEVSGGGWGAGGAGRCGAVGAGGAPLSSCGKLARFLPLRRAKPAAPLSDRSRCALPPSRPAPAARAGRFPTAPGSGGWAGPEF